MIADLAMISGVKLDASLFDNWPPLFNLGVLQRSGRGGFETRPYMHADRCVT
jgi:hypothetical protein